MNSLVFFDNIKENRFFVFTVLINVLKKISFWKSEINKNPSVSVEQVRFSLLELVQFTQLKLQTNDHNKNNVFQIVFTIVVLIDEVFINLKWDGQNYWIDNPIEMFFFNTANGGSFLLKYIEQSIEKEIEYEPVVFIYLMAIAYGFKGNSSEEYRKNLFSKLSKKLENITQKQENLTFSKPYIKTYEYINMFLFYSCIIILFLSSIIMCLLILRTNILLIKIK